MSKSYYGIDFGTTSSAVVELLALDDNDFKLLNKGDNQGRPIPSVVAINKITGEVVVGREAKDKKYELMNNSVYIPSIKMHLGEEWKTEIAGKEWTVVDVAAEIFKGLKENTRGEMEKAVVAVPIGFSANKRYAIRKAAQIAGIEIASFVSEPTAAFFSNYEHLCSCHNVVVFDWGGGTLDISVIRHENGKIEEMATGGLNIAGNNIDEKLARKVHEKICRKRGLNISYENVPATDKDNLIKRAEEIKIQFSDGEEDELTVRLNHYCNLQIIRETVTYDWFKEIIMPEISQAIGVMKEAIKNAGLNNENIDRILMTGGSSGLYPLYESLSAEYTDEKLWWTEENMWDVGKGTAMLSKRKGCYHSNQDVFLVMSNGSHFPLIQKGNEITHDVRNAFFGLTDQSEEVRLVFGGSEDLKDYAIFAAKAYGFLEEKIKMTYQVTENLIFQVKVISDRVGNDKEYLGTWEYDKLKLYYTLPRK